MSDQEFDIAVVGAGLVGGSFALATRGSGLRVALAGPGLEAGAPLDGTWDSRIYALAPDSVAFLTELGVWPLLDRSRIQPCVAMEVAGDRSGAIRFSAFDAGVPALAYIVESRALTRAMGSLISTARDPLRIASALEEASRAPSGEWSLQLSDGARITAGLLVGSDGGSSAVRSAGRLAARVLDYRQRAIVANFATERAHGGTAFQWFRNPDVLAYLPLPGNRMSMVWSVPDERADALMRMSRAELAREAAAAGAYRLGRLEALSPQSAFALHRVRATPMVGERLALIGDAAHIVHPLAGLGVNLGFRDARALAIAIRSRELFRVCWDTRVLSRYARARSEDILAVQTLTHAMQRLFAARGAAAATIRNFGLNLVDRLPVIKSMLTHRALAA